MNPIDILEEQMQILLKSRTLCINDINHYKKYLVKAEMEYEQLRIKINTMEEAISKLKGE